MNVIKPFEAPQKSDFNFYSNTTFWNGEMQLAEMVKMLYEKCSEA